MFFRLTFVKFVPETLEDAKRMYLNEITPIIRKQKGSIGVHLLEPSEISDDFISITEWETKADADAYESSGLYKQLVSKIAGHFSKTPVLKTYQVEEVLVGT